MTCQQCGARCHNTATRCEPCAASDRSRASWVTRRQNMDERFWDRVDRSGGLDACWLWLGAKQNGGYGFFRRHHRTVRASRYVLERTLGRELEPGEQACHHCDNPPCVNPAHLFVGSMADNHADKVAKGRQARGPRHGSARLTKFDIYSIRRRLADGEAQSSIARVFGVDPSTVSHIATGKTWGWL